MHAFDLEYAEVIRGLTANVSRKEGKIFESCRMRCVHVLYMHHAP